MNRLIRSQFPSVMRSLVLVMLIAVAPLALRAQWLANVGAESSDQSRQADAFLPNEIWIHAGDSITWTFTPVNEIHTVTFLTANQVRPSFGSSTCTAPSGSSFNGSSCVSSTPLSGGAKYSVTFPTAGNYKVVCLVHANMNGAIHVLPTSATLPYTQSVYDTQASDEAKDLINDAEPFAELGDFPGENAVLTRGEMIATAGGRQYLSIVRFLPGKIVVHVGDSVEWMNIDPTEPHTVTFGPANFGQTNVTTNADGSLQATISSTSAVVSSGILQAALEDRTGLAQSNLGITRIHITFTQPGTYSYICSIHVADGMAGTVQVVP